MRTKLVCNQIIAVLDCGQIKHFHSENLGPDNDELSGEEKVHQTKHSFGHISLGAPRNMETIDKLLETKSKNARYTGFIKKLEAFLCLELSDIHSDLLTVHLTTKV